MKRGGDNRTGGVGNEKGEEKGREKKRKTDRERDGEKHDPVVRTTVRIQ